MSTPTPHERSEASSGVPSHPSHEHGRHVWRFFQFLTPLFLRRLKLLVLIFAVATPLAALGGIFFRECVIWANELREWFPWLLAFLPLAGLEIVLLYRQNRVGLRDEIGVLIHSFETSNTAHPSTVPRRMAITVFIASVLTHLCGGSSGSEGASLLIGGGIGTRLAQHFHLHREEYRLLVFCTMASAFAPLLGTPFAAAFFVLERCPGGKLSFFIPCLLASFCSFGLALLMNVQPMRFALRPMEFEPTLIGNVLVLAVLCFMVGWLFRFLLHWVIVQSDTRFPNAGVPIFLGALVMVLLVCFLDTQSCCGTSISGIVSALHGNSAGAAFLWKLILTVITLGVGFKGGQIIPAFFIGSTFAVLVGPWIGLEPDFAAALGLIFVFASVAQCHVTAILISQEIFFHADPLFFLFGVVICVVLSRAEKQLKRLMSQRRLQEQGPQSHG